MALRKGKLFRARRSTIKIVGVRGLKSHQPRASFVEVTRQGKPKPPRARWQQTMRRERGFDGIVYLTWNGRDWTMPARYREVARVAGASFGSPTTSTGS